MRRAVVQSTWPAKVLPVDQAMKHRVAHDDRDVMGRCRQRNWRSAQRQSKEEDPEGRSALIDWPIDSRVDALTNAIGCSHATGNVHLQRDLSAR